MNASTPLPDRKEPTLPLQTPSVTEDKTAEETKAKQEIFRTLFRSESFNNSTFKSKTTQQQIALLSQYTIAIFHLLPHAEELFGKEPAAKNAEEVQKKKEETILKCSDLASTLFKYEDELKKTEGRHAIDFLKYARAFINYERTDQQRLLTKAKEETGLTTSTLLKVTALVLGPRNVFFSISEKQKDLLTETEYNFLTATELKTRQPRLYHLPTEKELGSGSFGVARKALDVTKGIFEVFKELKPRLPGDTRAQEEMQKEVAMLQYLHQKGPIDTFQHPPTAVVYITDQTNKMTKMGYIGKYYPTDLFGWISRQDISLADRLECCRQLVQGMKDMRKRGIFHRDIKPENIFMEFSNGKWKIKIADWSGATRQLREGDPLPNPATFHQFTPGYMTAEDEKSLRSAFDRRSARDYNNALWQQDLFAFCTTMITVFVQGYPYPNRGAGYAEMTQNWPLRRLLLERGRVNEQVTNLLLRMGQFNPSSRVSIEETDKFLDECDKIFTEAIKAETQKA